MVDDRSQTISAGDALSLHARLARIERLEAEREAFVRLGRRLAGAMSLRQVMEALKAESVRLLDWDSFFLACKVPERNLFRIVGYVDTIDGEKRCVPHKEGLVPEFGDPIRQVLEGNPLLLNRGENDEWGSPAPAGAERRPASRMFVPIRCDGGVVGVLSAQSYVADRYGEADLRVFQDIADAVAPALERAYTEEAFRRSQALLALERDLAVALSRTSDLNTALELLLEASLRIEGIDCGGVYVVDEGTGALDLVCHRRLSPGFVESISHLGRDSVHARLVNRAVPLYLPTAELSATEPACISEGLRSVASVPVMREGRPIAVLNLASRSFDDIPPGSRSAIETIAAQMGSVMVRIRAEEGLRQARDLLEQRVRERTAELVEANRRLQGEIDGRVRAERALGESEWKYRLLFEMEADGILLIDVETMRIVECNEAALEMYGYTREEMLKRTAPELSAEPEETAARIRSGGYVVRIPLRYHRKKDGTVFTVEMSTRFFDLNGRRMLLVAARDITQRRRAEQELREKEARNQAVLDAVPDTLFYLRGDGVIVGFKPGRHEQPPVSPEAFLNRNISDVLPADVATLMQRAVSQALAGGEVQAIEYQLVREGVRRFFEARLVAHLPNEVLALVRDITHRKQAEEALRHKECQLRRLSREATRDLERERSRIARELHDELGQMLTALNLNLAWLGRRLKGAEPALQERLAESVDYVARLVASVRDLAKSLRPAALSHQGLAEAVRLHAAEFEQYSGIRCEVSVEPADLEVPEPVVTAAFRIVQEALTNVARHSQATRCFITIESGADVLQVTVRDNGVGMRSTDLAGLRSLGLPGMRERAAILGGDVVVENAPEGGVRVTARLPLASGGTGSPAA